MQNLPQDTLSLILQDLHLEELFELATVAKFLDEFLKQDSFWMNRDKELSKQGLVVDKKSCLKYYHENEVRYPPRLRPYSRLHSDFFREAITNYNLPLVREYIRLEFFGKNINYINGYYDLAAQLQHWGIVKLLLECKIIGAQDRFPQITEQIARTGQEILVDLVLDLARSLGHNLSMLSISGVAYGGLITLLEKVMSEDKHPLEQKIKDAYAGAGAGCQIEVIHYLQREYPHLQFMDAALEEATGYDRVEFLRIFASEIGDSLWRLLKKAVRYRSYRVVDFYLSLCSPALLTTDRVEKIMKRIVNPKCGTLATHITEQFISLIKYGFISLDTAVEKTIADYRDIYNLYQDQLTNETLLIVGCATLDKSLIKQCLAKGDITQEKFALAFEMAVDCFRYSCDYENFPKCARLLFTHLPLVSGVDLSKSLEIVVIDILGGLHEDDSCALDIMKKYKEGLVELSEYQLRNCLELIEDNCGSEELAQSLSEAITGCL